MILATLLGTMSLFFVIGGLAAGVRLKANSGALDVRNAGDTGYAAVRVATPSGDQDAATKGYVDGLLAPIGPIRVNFAYDNTTPTSTAVIPAGSVISRVDVVVQTAFNDPTATVAVGYSGATSAWMSGSQSTPAFADDYQNQTAQSAPLSDHAVLVTVTPGSASQGSGYALVYFAEAQA